MTGTPATRRETPVKRRTYALTCGFACGKRLPAPLADYGPMRITPMSSRGTLGTTYTSGTGAALTARSLASMEVLT